MFCDQHGCQDYRDVLKKLQIKLTFSFLIDDNIQEKSNNHIFMVNDQHFLIEQK